MPIPPPPSAQGGCGLDGGLRRGGEHDLPGRYQRDDLRRLLADGGARSATTTRGNSPPGRTRRRHPPAARATSTTARGIGWSGWPPPAGRRPPPAISAAWRRSASRARPPRRRRTMAGWRSAVNGALRYTLSDGLGSVSASGQRQRWERDRHATLRALWRGALPERDAADRSRVHGAGERRGDERAGLLRRALLRPGGGAVHQSPIRRWRAG